jgi:hypothetical protein
MKTVPDIPSDLDVTSPDFVQVLNDRLRRMGDFVAGEVKRSAAPAADAAGDADGVIAYA